MAIFGRILFVTSIYLGLRFVALLYSKRSSRAAEHPAGHPGSGAQPEPTSR